jgi:polyphosphate kinase
MNPENFAPLSMDKINREISWLSFNDRVLQEAQDDRNPLIERFRFLGIYSNNMDEFFRVRVANIKRMTLLKKIQLDGFEGDANDLLDKIRKIVIAQQKKFETCYSDLILELEKQEIFQLNELTVNEEQKKELATYFYKEIKHVIIPIILKSNANFPKIKDKNIYLAVKMHTTKKPSYALIQIPSSYPRIYQFKVHEENKRNFILLDDIIRLNLESIFQIFDFEKVEAYTFKFTRDAELNLDDDLAISFIEKMEKSLKNRKKGDPVRFVYDVEMPVDLQHFLLKSLNLKAGLNTIPGGKYHNFKDFSRFPDFGRKELVYPTFIPKIHPDLEGQKSLIKVILQKDLLLHFPYQSFEYIVDILREAAIDPLVTSIKINIYRVAEDSQVLNALMNAVSNGKEVVAFFELQARFDEENNIIWAERLQERGAKVIYGYNNLKVHSKLFQISRTNKSKEQLITYIGTGNFHEKTAKVYTDICLLTSKVSISNEVKKVFQILENSQENHKFNQLLVSPFNNRSKILALIDKEIQFQKKSKNGFIQMKMNNLVDNEIIDKLYEASKFGVKIQLIVRGVCCLVPQQKKLSENIEVISIVDRFLEHSRFFIFNNAGEKLYFLSSADLMGRNLDKRIEVGVPILEKNLKDQIQFIFDTHWNDCTKARIIDKRQKNVYKDVMTEAIHSQQGLNEYYKLKSQIQKNLSALE